MTITWLYKVIMFVAQDTEWIVFHFLIAIPLLKREDNYIIFFNT